MGEGAEVEMMNSTATCGILLGQERAPSPLSLPHATAVSSPMKAWEMLPAELSNLPGKNLHLHESWSLKAGSPSICGPALWPSRGRDRAA